MTGDEGVSGMIGGRGGIFHITKQKFPVDIYCVDFNMLTN
jgi:hypothetical protein